MALPLLPLPHQVSCMHTSLPSKSQGLLPGAWPPSRCCCHFSLYCWYMHVGVEGAQQQQELVLSLIQSSGTLLQCERLAAPWHAARKSASAEARGGRHGAAKPLRRVCLPQPQPCVVEEFRGGEATDHSVVQESLGKGAKANSASIRHISKSKCIAMAPQVEQGIGSGHLTCRPQATRGNSGVCIPILTCSAAVSRASPAAPCAATGAAGAAAQRSAAAAAPSPLAAAPTPSARTWHAHAPPIAPSLHARLAAAMRFLSSAAVPGGRGQRCSMLQLQPVCAAALQAPTAHAAPGCWCGCSGKYAEARMLSKRRVAGSEVHMGSCAGGSTDFPECKPPSGCYSSPTCTHICKYACAYTQTRVAATLGQTFGPG